MFQEWEYAVLSISAHPFGREDEPVVEDEDRGFHAIAWTASDVEEHRVIYESYSGTPDPALDLCALGRRGWELVSVTIDKADWTWALSGFVMGSGRVHYEFWLKRPIRDD